VSNYITNIFKLKEYKMEDKKLVPLYMKVPEELKEALVSCAKAERKTVVGLFCEIIPVALQNRIKLKKVNEKKIKELIYNSKFMSADNFDV
jgi:hypothetical protein